MIKEFFKQISMIPRASFNEAKISDFLVEFANQRGLRVIQDEKKNVIIFKDASSGYESHPTLMLQSHIDMVAEKNQDSLHDFEKDPIELIERDGWLYANNTTLGADDGVGVAYMLAILDDGNLKHPALECVFTVEEETGMGGAIHLDTSVLSAKRMIGLDSSGEHTITISSTGGNRGTVTYKIKYERTFKHQVVLKVRGLQGGHSGVEIDQERASAVKIAAGILLNLGLDYNVGFSSINGGLKDNAIMRECDLVLGVKEEMVDDVVAKAHEIIKEYQAFYQHSDKDLRVEVEVVSKDCYTTSYEMTKEIAKLLTLLPYGYFHKSTVIKDLVVASANIGRIETQEEAIVIGMSMRSPNAFMLKQINLEVDIIADLCGAEAQFTAGYPGWDFDPHSEIRNIVDSAYAELHHGESMTLEATHGGLELGVWKGKMPELDIAAFGPIMEDIHTPLERLDLGSFQRTYEHLVRVLEKC